MVSDLPRGALKLAAEALSGDEKAARAALGAALEVIRRDAVRKAAKQILLLDAFQRDRLCRRCHGKTVYQPPVLGGGSLLFRCENGHEWPRRPNRGPWYNADSVLGRLARGEPMPDLPVKEAGDDA